MTRKDLRNAMQRLRDSGWEHVMSLMHADRDGDYGLLFTKEGRQFWLNIETYKSLPVEN